MKSTKAMKIRVMKSTCWIAAGLGLAALPAAMAVSAPPMPGINMAGTQMQRSPAAASPALAITLRPNPPIMGANILDILATNGATGKPLTGLKLRSTVVMTSMDMGTAHPVVKELGAGSYRTVVNFAMNGPWRVTLSGSGSAGKIAESFDFDAGGKAVWAQPKPDATGTDRPAAAVPKDAAVMGKTDAMTGMTETAANSRSDMGVPVLQPERVFTVTANHDWKPMSGFGHNAPMVKMMTLMMVEGSGMGEMKMAPIKKMDFGPENFAATNMNADTMLGTEAPRAAETPAQGGASPAKAPRAYVVPATRGPAPAMGQSAPVGLKITAVTPEPSVGENKIDIMVTDGSAPITGAKVSTSVSMMAMDMGTSHPVVTEMGRGHYMAQVNFSMAGPWRVIVKVTAPGQEPVTDSFDFDAKEK